MNGTTNDADLNGLTVLQYTAPLEPARQALHAGKLVVVPTDTVYGIAALAVDPRACERLYRIKRREPTKPMAVVFASIDDVFWFLPHLSPRIHRAVEVLLPGPYTLVVPNPDGFAPWLCAGRGSIGIRVPANALDLPPIAATSANMPGEQEAATISELPAPLAAEVSVAIDGGTLEPGQSSTIVDLVEWNDGGEVVIARDPVGRADFVHTVLGPLSGPAHR